MAAQADYQQATAKTADDLKSVAHSTLIRDLTELTLPEIDRLVDLIAQMVPAGNIPGLILNGLARLAGRGPTPQEARRDVNRLMQGVEHMLDHVVFATVFIGPAAVLWSYQQMLSIVGKSPATAFPEGVWQFYADYALREDTARHCNETHGFDTLLDKHDLRLDQADRITAWVMAALHMLHAYDTLLANEWRERVVLKTLQDVTADTPDAAHYATLYRAWEKQRPFGRGPDSDPKETYPAYRRAKFDAYVAIHTRDLPRKLRRAWEKQLKAAAARDLPAYQQQMSIISHLEPEHYGETRVPHDLRDTHIGLIIDDHYYLIPACDPSARGLHPPHVNDLRVQIAALLAEPDQPPAESLQPLATRQRRALATILPRLNKDIQAELAHLQTAPILLNFNAGIPWQVPLSNLRQNERGIGHHALTIFDTSETFVFDQSHIFFDGAWGAGFAEIMTQEATAWAVFLHDQSTAAARTPKNSLIQPLTFHFRARDHKLIDAAPGVTPHVSAESNRIDVGAMLALRRSFTARSQSLRLTINDLLILYRAIHALTYQPDPSIVADLKRRSRTKATRPAYEAALDTLEPHPASILMPVDASQYNPRDRLYPMTFDVPLAELDLLGLHQRTLAALDAYEQALLSKRAVRKQALIFEQFTALRLDYLAALAGFGEVMRAAKARGSLGDSASVSTIKLLAHLPKPLQRLLDEIPNRFDILNDMIKGREVFSNVGAVVPSSTLTRFATAKDDNQNKTLVWGILTDATGTLVVSLRDFRSYVAGLLALDQLELAERIAEDYLNAYVRGTNQFISDLSRIVLASAD